jgi:hypothetical protein
LSSRGGVPGSPDSEADRRGGSDPTDATEYRWVSYDILLSTLTDVLGVRMQNTANDAELDPIRYLEDRKEAVGAPDYTSESPDGAVTPGNFSSLGMKTWIMAASGACGMAMDGVKKDELFPLGVDNYNEIYVQLLGRLPKAEEVQILEEVATNLADVWNNPPQGSDPAEQAKYDAAKNNPTIGEARVATAVCTSILGSMEFLTVN